MDPRKYGNKMLESTHLSVHEFMDRLIVLKQKEERCASYTPPPRITEKPSELVYKIKPQSDRNFQRRDNNNQYKNGEKWLRSDNSEANKSPNWRRDAKSDAKNDTKFPEREQVSKQTERSSNEKQIEKPTGIFSNTQKTHGCFKCGDPSHNFMNCKNHPSKDWSIKKKSLETLGFKFSDSDESSDDENSYQDENKADEFEENESDFSDHG